MTLILYCSDIVPGCTFVAHGETREKALACASEHMRLKHKLHSVSPEVIAVIYGARFDDNGTRNERDASSLR